MVGFFVDYFRQLLWH